MKLILYKYNMPHINGWTRGMNFQPQGSYSAREVLTIKEPHHWMGHIAPEMAKQIVSNGAIDRIEIDSASTIQHCKLCKYAKATQKPIRKAHEAPRAPKFSYEIHSDVWGPSPIQTPGYKEYYVSFMDEYTWWTHI